MITAHCKLKGEIRAILKNPDGSIAYDSGWFPNLLTNQGLINLFESSWATNFNVGTSSAAPANTDTSLYGWLADDFSGPVSTVAGTGPNYEMVTTHQATFVAGAATGVLAEVGMNRHTYASNTKMSIRALLSPTINKASDQVLDLYYRLTRYPDLTDRTGTVTIEGTSYDYIVRPANLGTEDTSPANFGFGTAFGNMGLSTASSIHQCYTDTIAAYTSAPSTPLSQPWNSTCALTDNGSGYADYHVTWYLDRANGNIRSIYLREAGNNQSCTRGWQIRLGKTSDDSPLVKDLTKQLELDFRVTWARYP